MATPDPTPASGALPQLVRSRVALVRRGVISVRWVQGLCLGSAAGIVALAAGVHGGAALFSPGLMIVALFNGLVVLFLWTFVHRRNSAQVARDIDRALEFEGALFTAWEVEGESQPTELARRLGQVVAAGAAPREMLRAALPAALPMLAAPFAALTLLVSVLDLSRTSPTGQDLEQLARQVEQSLASVSAGGEGPSEGGSDGAGQDLSAVERRDLQQLLREAGALGESIESGTADGEDLAQMAAELAEMETRLGAGAGEDLREGLRRTQTALDAARMALAGRRAPGSADPKSTEGGGRGSSPGTGLASAQQDGKMSRPISPPTRAPQTSEAGVLGLPSWPKAYDGIVRRWVETARGSSPQ